jgi:hypothetical protein
MKPDKTLINFIIDDGLLKRIEDFRFKNRFQTRAAAIKWLLDYALKQKPSLKNVKPEIDDDEIPSELAVVPLPSSPPPALPEPATPARVSHPSRESMIQALKDQGYEVGEAVRHSDGHERILVRSHDHSAWVGDGQELQDLAAGRLNLGELSAKRAAGA